MFGSSQMAYEKAEKGDYSLVKELLDVARSPYDEQAPDIEVRHSRTDRP
jgi:hypothetical protein